MKRKEGESFEAYKNRLKEEQRIARFKVTFIKVGNGTNRAMKRKEANKSIHYGKQNKY